jgi:hypothetical protein
MLAGVPLDASRLFTGVAGQPFRACLDVDDVYKLWKKTTDPGKEFGLYRRSANETCFPAAKKLIFMG